MVPPLIVRWRMERGQIVQAVSYAHEGDQELDDEQKTLIDILRNKEAEGRPVHYIGGAKENPRNEPGEQAEWVYLSSIRI